MNVQLVKYGIEEWTCDLLTHVCFLAKKVYIYERQKMLKLLESNSYEVRSAYQGKIETGRGYIVPVNDIDFAEDIRIPDELNNCKYDESESIKGEKAVAVVKYLILNYQFPLIATIKEITEKDLQISGVDIIITLRKSIQVKCDYKGGLRDRGAGLRACYVNTTGNLFIQTHECNPFHKH